MNISPGSETGARRSSPSLATTPHSHQTYSTEIAHHSNLFFEYCESVHCRHTVHDAIEFTKYVIVFTTLPQQRFSAKSVLEWYRVRWQIELIFKRLKSLAGLGHLPKHDDASSRAWLYGKLLVGLLVEKLITQASAISPWGYSLEFDAN